MRRLGLSAAHHARIPARLEALRDAAPSETPHRDCPTCGDQLFLAVTDPHPYPHVRAKPCPDCLGLETDPPLYRNAELETMNWWIDHDGQRLVCRQRDKAAMWLYPDGRLVQYPPYGRLPSAYPGVWARLHADAARQRRDHRRVR